MQAWGQLFAVIFPPENLMLLCGAVLLCISLLFNGITKPFTFSEINTHSHLAILAGLLSPTRYFVEALVVSDVLCLPEQYGWTKDPQSSNIDFNALDQLGLAKKDVHVERNCRGWGYATPRLLITGLLLRVLALLIINIQYQSAGNIFKSMRGWNQEFIIYLVVLFIVFVALFTINIHLILN